MKKKIEKDIEDKIKKNVEKCVDKNAGRFFGHIISIVIILVIAWLVNKYWRNFSFFTEEFTTVLLVYNVSIGADIVSNLVQAFSRNFRINHFMKAIESAFSFAVVYSVYQFFPFDVSSSVATWIRIIAIIIMVAVSIATIVELVKSITGSRLGEKECK